MPTKRQAITPAMKIDALLYREKTLCSLCSEWVLPGQEIEWDHIHALVHGGQHDYTNLRPVHAGCHKKKTAQDIKANAKIKRIRGETKQGPKRAIPSRPWPKRGAL